MKQKISIRSKHSWKDAFWVGNQWSSMKRGVMWSHFFDFFDNVFIWSKCKIGNKPPALERQTEESRCRKMARPCREIWNRSVLNKNRKTLPCKSRITNQINSFLETRCREYYHDSVHRYTLLMWLQVLCKCHWSPCFSSGHVLFSWRISELYLTWCQTSLDLNWQLPLQ